MPEKAGSSPDSESNRRPVEPVPLPEVTHLQFAILDVLSTFRAGLSAVEVRQKLLTGGLEQNGPKFYQLMKRLVAAKLVETWQQEFDVAGSDVNRTFYRLTGNGKTAWRITMQFYAVRLRVHRDMIDTD